MGDALSNTSGQAAERHVVITGAGSGIGAAVAKLLAGPNVHLWLTFAHDSVGAEATARLCSELGAADVQMSALDLRDPAQIDRLFAVVAERWGHLHVLVNNGAACPYTRFDEITIEEWDEVLETNARGTFLATRTALPLLRAAPGDRAIVNVSSVAGQIGAVTTGAHYAASKAAVLAITRSFARILASEGIRVNAVTPGPVTSNITSRLPDETAFALSNAVPLGRFGTAHEVAHVIAMLAAPEASFITGATYDVNGGTRID